jgi:hypothetical protein
MLSDVDGVSLVSPRLIEANVYRPNLVSYYWPLPNVDGPYVVFVR